MFLIKTKLHFVLGFIVFFQTTCHSQNCDSLVSYFSEKIYQNYSGFSNENEKRLFLNFTNRLLKKQISCEEKLAQIIYYFNDTHLRFFLYTGNTSRDTSALLRKRTDTRGLEGLWKNERGDKLIVITKKSKGRYEAVILKSANSSLQPGMIHYEMQLTSRNRCNIKANTIGRSYFVMGRINRVKQLIVGSVEKWNKVINDSLQNLPSVSKYNFNPALEMLRGGTVLIKIPQCSFEAKTAIDSLVRIHQADLTSAERIILDLRENSGGTVLALEMLLPYIGVTKVVSHQGFIICSDDNIRSYEATGKELVTMDLPPDIVKSELQKIDSLKKYRGGIYREPVEITGYKLPDSSCLFKKTGIIINYRTASAAEIFLLKAMQGKNVLVFGEPSAGGVRTVEMNSFFSPDSAIELNVPMVRIELKGIKNITKDHRIKPDVFLYSNDWIEETKNYLMKQKK